MDMAGLYASGHVPIKRLRLGFRPFAAIQAGLRHEETLGGVRQAQQQAQHASSSGNDAPDGADVAAGSMHREAHPNVPSARIPIVSVLTSCRPHLVSIKHIECHYLLIPAGGSALRRTLGRCAVYRFEAAQEKWRLQYCSDPLDALRGED